MCGEERAHEPARGLVLEDGEVAPVLLLTDGLINSNGFRRGVNQGTHHCPPRHTQQHPKTRTLSA